MRNVQMLHTEPKFVSIPVEQAIYCENCETVSNSSNSRCGVCGSEAITRLSKLIGGTPDGPGSGPAPACCIVPTLQFETVRRAA
jgi:hypothetical protein